MKDLCFGCSLLSVAIIIATYADLTTNRVCYSSKISVSVPIDTYIIEKSESS